MIETATLDDLDTLVELWITLIETGQTDGSQLRGEANRAIARDQLAGAIVDDRAMVARQNEHIRGFVTVTHDTGIFDCDRSRGRIRNLFVRATDRGNGIGTALLKEAQEQLSEAGVESILVETPAGNTTARAFYHHHGYRPHRIELEKEVENNRKGDPG